MSLQTSQIEQSEPDGRGGTASVREAKGRGLLSSCSRFVVRYLPVALMAWGLGFALFMLGFLVGALHLPSYDQIEEARLTALIAWRKLTDSDRLPSLGPWSDVSLDQIQKHRVVVKEPVNDDSAFLVTGGEAQFLEFCPGHGCAAVILKRDGTLVHAYPYRPEELITKRIVDLPYGEVMHDHSKDTAVFGLAPLANGDLIVVYDFIGATPYAGGIARMDKNGHLRWYRRDYTGHWPAITPDNEILDIGHTMGPERIRIAFDQGAPQSFVCAGGIRRDVIRILDLDGNVKDEIPILDALMESAYRSRLLNKIKPLTFEVEECDPTHTNSVVPVGPELAARLNGVAPADLLVSLRNVSALAIIGRSDHAVKYLFTGSFIFQHSAQILPGGKIVLFDNLGGSPDGGPSRVLLLDPATGEEKTIFPNKDTPKDVETFSRVVGNIDVSEDGTRALVSIYARGKAYEIRLADGAVLTSFEHLHDVHSLPQFADSPKKARYFLQYGVYYVPPRIAESGT
jgi:hypothetical protein